jgi:hypothetical protein
MNTLKDLIEFTKNLKSVIDHVSKTYPKDSESFRCIAGPWLSRQLLPRPEQENSCRFLSCYVNSSKSDFVDEVLKPLVGGNPFNGTKVCAGQQSILGQLQAFRPEYSPKDFKLLRGLELRLATILCVHECDSSLTIRLKALIYAYQEFFGDSKGCWSETQASQRSEKTVAWHALKSVKSDIADAIDKIISGLQASYLDPAIAFLIDTLLECSGSQHLIRNLTSEDKNICSDWDAGHSWVMTVATKQDRSVIFKLLVEAVRYKPKVDQPEVQTVGAFYPHPLLGVSFQINSVFQEGIRNAWLATVGQNVANGGSWTTDFRWSLIPYDDQPLTFSDFEEELAAKIVLYNDHPNSWHDVKDESLRHLCLWNPLSGPSATLAFGIALRSALEGDVLRKDMAATAEFSLLDIDCNTINSNPLLSPVGAVRVKLEEAKKFGIKHLLVATQQTDELFMGKADWRKHSTFMEAYKDAHEIEDYLRIYSDLVAGRWDRIVQAGLPKSGQEVT